MHSSNCTKSASEENRHQPREVHCRHCGYCGSGALTGQPWCVSQQVEKQLVQARAEHNEQMRQLKDSVASHEEKGVLMYRTPAVGCNIIYYWCVSSQAMKERKNKASSFK